MVSTTLGWDATVSYTLRDSTTGPLPPVRGLQLLLVSVLITSA